MKDIPNCARCCMPASDCECSPDDPAEFDNLLRQDLGFTWRAAKGNWHPSKPIKQPATQGDLLLTRLQLQTQLAVISLDLLYGVTAILVVLFVQSWPLAWYYRAAAMLFGFWWLTRDARKRVEKDQAKRQELIDKTTGDMEL